MFGYIDRTKTTTNTFLGLTCHCRMPVDYLLYTGEVFKFLRELRAEYERLRRIHPNSIKKKRELQNVSN